MSELPHFVGDIALGPEQTWPEHGYQLEMPDFTSALRPGHRMPSPESGNIVELPDVAVDHYFGLGKLLLASGDTVPDITRFPGLAASTSDGADVRQLSTLVWPDLVCVFGQGSGVSSPESGTRFGKPDFTGDIDRR